MNFSYHVLLAVHNHIVARIQNNEYPLINQMKRQIGQVFTPLKWAEWLINRWGVFDAWLDGAHVCDPTAGQGAFALAMLHIARQKGVPITRERLSRLTLIEIVPSHLERFREDIKREFGVDVPASQVFCQDVITEDHPRKYDILVGNPPWANFSALPTAYKERLKPFFLQEGLVPDRKKMLLGASRIDIAALVLKVVLGRLLKENGTGYFYIPTSLFFGDGGLISALEITLREVHKVPLIPFGILL